MASPRSNEGISQKQVAVADRLILSKFDIAGATQCTSSTRRRTYQPRRPERTARARGHLDTSVKCRLCCKSLFAPLIANFSSCRRGFRVNMWRASSPGDKLTGDFGNEPDATSISDRGLFRLLAGNLSPGVFRLLQHNRHFRDIARSQIDFLLSGEKGGHRP